MKQNVPGVWFASPSTTTPALEEIWTGISRAETNLRYLYYGDRRALSPLLGIVTAHDLPSARGANARAKDAEDLIH